MLNDTCHPTPLRNSRRQAANVATGTGWSMIRVGYGGNGILMHWDDATTAGEYLISNMNRAPVDWLLPEWASSLTEPGSTWLAALDHIEQLFWARSGVVETSRRDERNPCLLHLLVRAWCCVLRLHAPLPTRKSARAKVVPCR